MCGRAVAATPHSASLTNYRPGRKRFRHLYGTRQLHAAEGRALVRGFVLNKFRSDATLLEPGPTQIAAAHWRATVAVLALWREHGLPEEDGLRRGPYSSAAPVRR